MGFTINTDASNSDCLFSSTRIRKYTIVGVTILVALPVLWIGSLYKTDKTLLIANKKKYDVVKSHLLENYNCEYNNGSKSQQIENYKHNKSLVLNVHITHHAGTFTCHFFRKFQDSKTPSFGCNGGPEWPLDLQDVKHPWKDANETSYMISRLREQYTMTAWEFSAASGNPKPSLSDTNWEDPNLVSIIVMRNPMDRLLAGDGFVSRRYGGFDKMTSDQWWEFASETYHTNNFALTILAGNGCCDGENTPEYHLETAKKLVSRFTFVIDQDCLTDGFIALAIVLGEPLSQFGDMLGRSEEGYRKKHELTAEERIGNSTLYEYLLKRNHYDIELYEWSKAKSLVKCADILAVESDDNST